MEKSKNEHHKLKTLFCSIFIFKMKFAFAFVFAFCLPCALILACKTMDELDDCAYEMNLFLVNSHLKIPSNDGEMLEMCARAKKGIKCLKDEEIKCVKGPLKVITTKIFNDWENHFNSRCDSPAHRADYLKHIQCFADPAKAAVVRVCADKHMIMMDKVSNLPKNLIHGGSCCSSIEMRDCIMNEIRTQCPGETGEYFHEMLHEMVEENHELACGEYMNMDQCNAKYDAATWKDLKAIYDSNDLSALKYKTVVPIFFKMIQAESTRRK